LEFRRVLFRSSWVGLLRRVRCSCRSPKARTAHIAVRRRRSYSTRCAELGGAPRRGRDVNLENTVQVHARVASKHARDAETLGISDCTYKAATCVAAQ